MSPRFRRACCVQYAGGGGGVDQWLSKAASHMAGVEMFTLAGVWSLHFGFKLLVFSLCIIFAWNQVLVGFWMKGEIWSHHLPLRLPSSSLAFPSSSQSPLSISPLALPISPQRPLSSFALALPFSSLALPISSQSPLSTCQWVFLFEKSNY